MFSFHLLLGLLWGYFETSLDTKIICALHVYWIFTEGEINFFSNFITSGPLNCGGMWYAVRLFFTNLARKLFSGLIIRYVSLNITEKTISKSNIFTGNQTHDSFMVFSPSFAVTDTFRFGTILLLCLVFGYQKPSSPGMKPTKVFRCYDTWFFKILFESVQFS